MFFPIDFMTEKTHEAEKFIIFAAQNIKVKHDCIIWNDRNNRCEIGVKNHEQEIFP